MTLLMFAVPILVVAVALARIALAKRPNLPSRDKTGYMAARAAEVGALIAIGAGITALVLFAGVGLYKIGAWFGDEANYRLKDRDQMSLECRVEVDAIKRLRVQHTHQIADAARTDDIARLDVAKATKKHIDDLEDGLYDDNCYAYGGD